MNRSDEPIDWGSWHERTELMFARWIPKDQRGTPKHLRANLELLWGAGSTLLFIGLLMGETEAIVLGILGWFIGVAVAIRLVWSLRTR